MTKTLILLLAFMLLGAIVHVSAQSNEVLDALLEEETTSFGQAAYLVLTASARIPDDTSPAEAAEEITAQGWKLPARTAEEPLTLGEYSFLLMQAFELKGGIMYRIIPGPRYAGRELAYLKFIKGNTSPYRTFSGEEAIGILGRLMEWKEERL
jgi:hypothetical protein